MIDRDELRQRVLELLGRDGMSYGAAAKLLGMTRGAVAGFDARAQHHNGCKKRRRGSRPQVTLPRRASVFRSFGEALHAQSITA